MGRLAKFANHWLRRIPGLKRDFSKALGLAKPYAGSQWWVLSGQAVKYLLDYIENHPGYVRFFRHSFIPDEMFFHSILGNSPFRERAMGKLTFSDWSRPEPPYPAWIDWDHIHQLESFRKSQTLNQFSTREYCFARKFSDESGPLLDWIDAVLRVDQHAIAYERNLRR